MFAIALFCVFALNLTNLVFHVPRHRLVKQKQSAPVKVNSTVAFNAGVASGDPTESAVILWTRINNYSGSVSILVSKSRDFKWFKTTTHYSTTNQEYDFIVKVDIVNLSPNTIYYYKFVVKVGSKKIESQIGRTRTLPTSSNSLKIAVASCNNFPYGYFTPYKVMVDMQVDLVVFLGDYIYEYKNGHYVTTNVGRIPNPNIDLLTLSDYRKRHLQYKQDKDLQYMHSQIPMIAVWDDHEFADNSWNSGSKELPHLFKQRKLAAMQAYFEYIPIRVFPSNIFDPIYRTFVVGDLLELIMLDTRSKRDQTDVRNPIIVGNPNRTILGTEQEKWLVNLPVKKVKWSLYGNQILMGIFYNPLHHLNVPILSDAWDDYPKSRQFMVKYMLNRQLGGGGTPVVLSGDIHISMHNEFQGITEIVTPSIASPNVEGYLWSRTLQRIFNLVKGVGDYKWANIYEKGFTVLNINSTDVLVQWIHMNVKKDVYDYKIGKTIRIPQKNQ